MEEKKQRERKERIQDNRQTERRNGRKRERKGNKPRPKALKKRKKERIQDKQTDRRGGGLNRWADAGGRVDKAKICWSERERERERESCATHGQSGTVRELQLMSRSSPLCVSPKTFL